MTRLTPTPLSWVHAGVGGAAVALGKAVMLRVAGVRHARAVACRSRRARSLSCGAIATLSSAPGALDVATRTTHAGRGSGSSVARGAVEGGQGGPELRPAARQAVSAVDFGRGALKRKKLASAREARRAGDELSARSLRCCAAARGRARIATEFLPGAAQRCSGAPSTFLAPRAAPAGHARRETQADTKSPASTGPFGHGAYVGQRFRSSDLRSRPPVAGPDPRHSIQDQQSIRASADSCQRRQGPAGRKPINPASGPSRLTSRLTGR
jgi:hypothetical protein